MPARISWCAGASDSEKDNALQKQRAFKAMEIRKQCRIWLPLAACSSLNISLIHHHCLIIIYFQLYSLFVFHHLYSLMLRIVMVYQSIYPSVHPCMWLSICEFTIAYIIHAIFGKVMDSLSLSILVVHACILVILPTVKYWKVGVCWCFWNWYRVCWLKVVEICSGECCWIDAVGYAVASEHWHM